MFLKFCIFHKMKTNSKIKYGNGLNNQSGHIENDEEYQHSYIANNQTKI